MKPAPLAMVLALVAASSVARADVVSVPDAGPNAPPVVLVPDAPDADGGLPGANEGAPPLSFAPSPRVVEVVVHAPRRFTARQLSDTRAQIGIRAGDPLSRDAVRDAVERLFASGEFTDVVVSAEDRPGGVALIFELPPQKKIVSFSFQGASFLRRIGLAKVAMSAITERGAREKTLPTPYFPEQLERMRAALERDYQDRGFQSAKVSARAEEENESEVSITFSIDEGPPTRIAAISVAGEPRLSPEELSASLGLVIGQVLDKDAVEHGIQNLRTAYQRAHFYRAQVGQPVAHPLDASGERAQLMLPVEAGPEMRFHFHGNVHFDSRVLEAKLGFVPEDTLDETEEDRMARRVRTFYVLNGFFDAQVTPEEIWSPDRSKLVVIFDVDEGEPLIVKRVQFEGSKHFDNDFLVDRVHESLREAVPAAMEGAGGPNLEEGEAALPASDQVTGAPAYRPEPDQVFAEGPYKDALARIVDLYRADGFLDVAVDLPRIEVDEHTRNAVVYVPVNEGPQTTIGGVRVEGLDDTSRLQKLSSLKLGAPFNTADEENTRLAIKRGLQQEGYLFADVKDAELFSEDRTRVNVVYQVKTGPLVHVRSIIVRGNEFTRESVIRAGVALEPGDLFDAEKVSQSERNLAALGTFTRVEAHALDPDHEDAEKDLVVEVDERPRTNIVASAGGSLVDGPRAFLEANRANLFGLGLEATMQAKVNYFNWSYPVLGSGQLAWQPGIRGFGGHVNLGLRDPRIFLFQPAQVAAHIDLVAERINRPAYYFDREAANLGFDWVVTRWLAASLLNTVETDNVHKPVFVSALINNLSFSDLQNLRFAEGRTYLYSLTPSVTLDLRDNTANPHSGFLFITNAELTHDLGGDTAVYYVKPQVSATVYIPVGKRATLAVSARGGRVFPLSPDSTTIAPKRFYLGGAGTLRGFPEDGLIPEDVRPSIQQQVADCHRLVNDVGCSDASNILRKGLPLPSEGGQAYVLYKGELRFPISGNFEGALFVDAGNLWLDPTLVSLVPSDLRITPGAGLRYGTPVGPIALDVGMNPFPDAKLNETTFSTRYVQFSIGLF